MKKCPYCKTLMNDDVNSCPNCLKDTSNVESMPSVSLTSGSKPTNLTVYGAVLAVGGIIAAISQSINKVNYQKKYDELAELISKATTEASKQELVIEAYEYLNLINDCSFREVFFYIISGVGLVIVGISLFMLLKKKLSKKEK